MKLRRSLPSKLVWIVFLIFDFVMVASSSFFLGLFPANAALIYCVIFSLLCVLAVSVLVIGAGKLSDTMKLSELPVKLSFRIIYPIVIALIIVGGIWYRLELLGLASGDIRGKMSLYENAMVGGTPSPEYDLLSIVYSSILRVILLFTGNIISVPFFFQTACFAVFMICGYITVKKLLGYAAALVFTAYVAFMPVFTPLFTGLELSTDYLFMAMFGIELLVVALFLEGAYKQKYTSRAYEIWYFIVGVVVGFMAYVDAGTIIMILPFIFSPLLFYKRDVGKEACRLIVIALGGAIAFIAMFAQEQGIMMADVRFANWCSYYFHNLNTFSMFWTYTDYKVLYLVTVILMSGVFVGFWKNLNIEKVSPWMLSVLFIVATVPFMGATRMNTQVFVTVYYALILGCVASLITLPADEGANEYAEGDAASEEASIETSEAVTSGETAQESSESETVQETKEKSSESETSEETSEESPKSVTTEETTEESSENAADEPATDYEFEDDEEEPSQSETASESSESKTSTPRYVPEGMVLPEDPEDLDQTPRMKIPEFVGTIAVAKVVSKELTKEEVTEEVIEEATEEVKEETAETQEPEPEITNEPPVESRDETETKPKATMPIVYEDDFDVKLRPGDDFDI